MGRRSLPASSRPPSGEGAWAAPSSVSSRSLAELATSAMRSAVGCWPGRSGDSPRPESVTAGIPSAIGGPWSPKVWGTAMCSSCTPSEGAPSLRPPARPMERSASWPSRSACLSARPSLQTSTSSPSASPGASRAMAAAIGNDEKRLRNQRMPALPIVLPSVETKMWGRWWREVAEARAIASITEVAVVPPATPGGVSRGATTRMPARTRPSAAPGTTR